ncbi:hypothetical protein Pyn_09820 [Prunus yedoensis var. nudiflora]|uniref:Fibronectin type III-like domain-containing protein n=1 Tax=Prunus yedoensis var. nudiflora TaxID=2094558 RepID=A0A314YAP7_PRUYE|nr:hypothetical protein Pyn_09820 [Prunus yedoensis var. nudiflora]
MVASAYAIEFVKGFQGGNWGIRHDGFGERRVLEGHDGGSDDGLMLSACCKHFTAYDLELWGNLVDIASLLWFQNKIWRIRISRLFVVVYNKGLLWLWFFGCRGIPCSSKSLFEGLQEYTKRASYAAGCLDVPCKSRAGFQEAIHTVKRADFVVIVVGLDLTQERGDHDRVSLLLPGKQMALVSSVAAASKEPVILVLTGGGPLDVTFAKEEPRIASILWIGYPGESGGRALAEVLFGDFNPDGRLPITWYPESFTNIPMNDMKMRADPSQGYPGRTYRFYTGSRLYGFGDGLSYSKFTYNIISAPKKLSLSRPLKVDSSGNILQQAGDTLDYLRIDEVTSSNSLRFFVEITVTNIGDMDGGHTVMLFSRMTKVVKGAPKQQLIEFNRVHTGSYKSTATSILVDPCTHFSFANDYGEWILPLGDHRLMVGDIEHIVSIEIN